MHKGKPGNCGVDALRVKETVLIHHNDVDRLCPAAITRIASERVGMKVKTFCLEKAHKEAIEDLHSRVGKQSFM